MDSDKESPKTSNLDMQLTQDSKGVCMQNSVKLH